MDGFPEAQFRMSAYVDTRTLGAASAETFTAPTGYSSCIITSNSAATYIRRGGTAVAGVSDVVDGTASIYIPQNVPRMFNLNDPVAGGTVPKLASFSCIVTGGGQVTVEWFP